MKISIRPVSAKSWINEIIILKIIISRPACGAPAYTEHRHSKSFDLWILTKATMEKINCMLLSCHVHVSEWICTL